MRGIAAGFGRRKIFGMRFAKNRQLGNEVVAENGQGFELQTELRKFLDVDKMFRLLAMLKGQVGCVSPSVGFAREEGDAFGRFGRLNKAREICRQAGQRKLINEAMALVVPGRRRLHSYNHKK